MKTLATMQRRQAILDLVRGCTGWQETRNIADRFGGAIATVRGDLKVLEQAGLIERDGGRWRPRSGDPGEEG